MLLHFLLLIIVYLFYYIPNQLSFPALGLHMLVVCHAKRTFLYALGLHPLVACHAKWTLFRDLRLQKTKSITNSFSLNLHNVYCHYHNLIVCFFLMLITSFFIQCYPLIQSKRLIIRIHAEAVNHITGNALLLSLGIDCLGIPCYLLKLL